MVSMSRVTHAEHLDIFRKGNIVDAYGEVKGVGEVDGPVHWIYGTVSDVEQGGRVVKAQIPITDRRNVFSHGNITDMLVMIMNERMNVKIK